MKKIVIGYERINTDTGQGMNFNGRSEPNKIKFLEDVSKLNPYNQFMYKLVIEPHSNTDLVYRDFLSGYNNEEIVRKSVHEIYEEKYIYPIEIRASWLYTTHTSDISISEKVINDIKNNKAFLVFIYQYEGDMRYTIEKFRILVNTLNLPKKNVFLLHGDYDISFYKDDAFTYVPVNCFPFWLSNYKRSHISNYQPKHLYVNYNRMQRQHRTVLLSWLFKYKLIDFGLISCGNIRTDVLLNTLRKHFPTDDLNNLTEFFTTISGKSPDNKTLDTENPACEIVEDHYKQTFVSLVAETLSDGLFFSEKIYKPIMIGHPFILMGAPGQLAALKEFGFRTFDRWWDESYDNIENMSERAERIVQILDTLNKKSKFELASMRTAMRPILIHNQQLYNSMVQNKQYHEYQPIVEFFRTLLN